MALYSLHSFWNTVSLIDNSVWFLELSWPSYDAVTEITSFRFVISIYYTTIIYGLLRHKPTSSNWDTFQFSSAVICLTQRFKQLHHSTCFICFLSSLPRICLLPQKHHPKRQTTLLYHIILSCVVVVFLHRKPQSGTMSGTFLQLISVANRVHLISGRLAPFLMTSSKRDSSSKICDRNGISLRTPRTSMQTLQGLCAFSRQTSSRWNVFWWSSWSTRQLPQWMPSADFRLSILWSVLMLHPPQMFSTRYAL